MNIPTTDGIATSTVEWALALLVGIGLFFSMLHLWQFGYLAQPYFYVASDTFMDWFNVAEWGRDKGAYDTWGSIYLPINFIFLKIFGIDSCYAGADPSITAIYARSCDWVGIGSIHLVYLINLILVSVTFVKLDRVTAPQRSFALIAGLPMTFGLERGNLIMLAFAGLVLGFGPILKTARGRWLAVAVAINFKLYLLTALFPQLLRRRWRWFEGALIWTVVLYIATYYLHGNGSILEVIKNLGVTQSVDPSQFGDVLFAGTYNTHIAVLKNSAISAQVAFGTTAVNFMSFTFPLLVILTEIMIALAVFAALIRPEVVPTFRLTNFALAVSFIIVDTVIYGYVIIILFTFFEKWKGFGAKYAIVACYLLCMPFDYNIGRLSIGPDDSFLSGQVVEVSLFLNAGAFIRPAIFYSILIALACATLRTVWLDVRTQGWKSRWRFRDDLPLFRGAGGIHKPL